MRMAVVFQYELPSAFVQVLVPTALTIWATHDGPAVLLTSPIWSELIPSGVTQDTPASLQFVDRSDNTSDGLRSTFDFHSLPLHFLLRAAQMWEIALGAIQILLALA